MGPIADSYETYRTCDFPVGKSFGSAHVYNIIRAERLTVFFPVHITIDLFV